MLVVYQQSMQGEINDNEFASCLSGWYWLSSKERVFFCILVIKTDGTFHVTLKSYTKVKRIKNILKRLVLAQTQSTSPKAKPWAKAFN